MVFAERLRYLIDCQDIKLKTLAPKLGISPSTLSNYTQGTREPDYEVLVRIADYFGVSTDYLLGREESPQGRDAEVELMHLFRRMTPAQRDLLLEQARPLVRYRVAHKI